MDLSINLRSLPDDMCVNHSLHALTPASHSLLWAWADSETFSYCWAMWFLLCSAYFMLLIWRMCCGIWGNGLGDVEKNCREQTDCTLCTADWAICWRNVSYQIRYEKLACKQYLSIIVPLQCRLFNFFFSFRWLLEICLQTFSAVNPESALYDLQFSPNSKIPVLK